MSNAMSNNVEKESTLSEKTKIVAGALDVLYTDVLRNKTKAGNKKSLIEAANEYIQNPTDKMAKLNCQQAFLEAKNLTFSIADPKDAMICKNFINKLEDKLFNLES